MHRSKLEKPARDDLPLGWGSALITLFILSGCSLAIALFAMVAEFWRILKMIVLMTKVKLKTNFYKFIHNVRTTFFP